MPRKRRTRQHVIADLSINYVERFVLTCGYSVERIRADYGTDLIISTYNAEGEIENGLIYVQVKATDTPIVPNADQRIPIVLQTKDLDLWLREAMPY
jgi:NDP-sugar pyrophosphorylase family protein